MQPFGLTLELPQLDRLDSFNSKLIGWWLVRRGECVPNLANSQKFNGTAKSGATMAGFRGMPVFQFDGTANAYIDLGSAALLDSADPFTLAWWENPSTSSGALGAFVLCPSNASSQKFIVLRIDSGSYSTLTTTLCNRALNTQIPRFSAPTLASSIGVPRLWVLRGANGMASTSLGDYSLNIDGVAYGSTAAGTSIGSFTGSLNYIGWDSIDSNWTGWLGNVRLWRRTINDEEIRRMRAEWLAGAVMPDETSRGPRRKAALFS